jgi:putative transposase
MVLDAIGERAMIRVMPRQPRFVVPGLAHHVTQRGVRRTALFDADDDRALYVELLAAECGRFGTEILAWCLMTNHVHLVAVPEREASLSRAIGEAHKRYTRAVNLRSGVRG